MTEEINFGEEDYVQIQGLVTSANPKRLNAWLGCKSRKPRVDDTKCKTTCPDVASSTPKAHALLKLFRSILSEDIIEQDGNDDEECSLGVDDILQALLMIDPLYSTPWEALDGFASSIQNHSGSIFPLLQCVSSIEDFFLRAKFPFPSSRTHSDRKEIPQFIRKSIVDFVLKLSKHWYLGEDETNVILSSSNEANPEKQEPVVRKLVSDLICTVCSVCKHWCNDLFSDIVAIVHIRKPSIPRIKAWLQQLRLTYGLLSSKQIEQIARILIDQLCEESSFDILPAEDMTAIVSIVLEMANETDPITSNKEETSNQVGRLWREGIFLALHRVLTTQSCECYVKCERDVKEWIEKWSVGLLKSWIAEIVDKSSIPMVSSSQNTIPSWYGLNLLSICTDVLRAKVKSWRPRLVDMVVVGIDEEETIKGGNLISEQECESILKSILGDEVNPFLDGQYGFDEVYYKIGGSFYVEEDDALSLDCLSKCGPLISKTLKPEEWNIPEKVETETFDSALLVPRAVRLVDMAESIATNCSDQHLRKGEMLATVVNTVAYFEVPEFRNVLEMKIQKGLSEPSRLQNCYHSTIRLILSSALKMGDRENMIDTWSKIVDSSNQASRVSYLGHIFATLPIARSRFLSRSKKLLAPLYSHPGAYNFEMETGDETVGTTLKQRCVDGMLGLLELIKGDIWGGNEIQAWAILSDALVQDAPPLPMDTRQWLLQILMTSVTNGIFNMGALDHLLRATSIRLSSLFAADSTNSNVLFVKSRQMEEVASLHRLMTIIFKSLATGEKYSENRQILLAQGREDFLRSILSYKRGQSSQNHLHDGILKKYHSIKATTYDGFNLCWLLFLTVNSYLLDNALTERSKSEAHDASLKTFADEIKEIEDRELRERVESDSINEDVLPLWPSTETKVVLGSSSAKETSKNSNLKNALLDLLLEFLFMVPLPPREYHNFNDPLSWKVIIATGFLTSQKGLSLVSKDPTLSVETIRETGQFFFSICSDLIRDAILRDCGLSALEDVLGPTVSYCRALDMTLETKKTDDCATMVSSLWHLYQTIASEKACVQIISYLESHISENHDASVRRNHDLFSLRFLYSESDVDETVQELRLSCLRPFRKCLAALSEENGPAVPWDLVSNILGELVKDLRSGLDGNSGGLPPELYITYCESIDECASFLFNQKDPSFRYSIFLQFKDVTTTLTNILVTIPLRDAKLFKTTFIFAAAVFPSMCRDLVRRSLCYSDLSAPVIDDNLGVDSELLDGVREDCLAILNRWGPLREPNLIPWLDIAGPDHSEMETSVRNDRNDHNESSNVSVNSTPPYDEEVPRFVHVPSPSRNRHKVDSPREKTQKRIRLFSKEVWSWAISCLFLGLEQKWLNSERTIQIGEETNSPNQSHESLSEWNRFFGARKVELRKSLLDISRFFHSSQGFVRRDQRGNRVLLDMMAMNLPSAPRLRLCFLVECVSRVLICSIQRVCSFWSGEAKSSTPELSIFESICCLSAWLSFDEESDGDFSVGLFKWLAIASRKRPPSELNPSKKADTTELFERVSTVADHVHKLYFALKELQKTLRGHTIISDEGCIEHKCVRTFFKGENTKDEILRLSALKLHCLQQVMPKEFHAKSFPDFPTSNAAKEVDSETPRKKRSRLEKGIIPTARTKPKRPRRKSRNKVVDIFMDLDQGISSPRRKSRDAYADLEDFLVEG